MRISDWSSDVCSSDLRDEAAALGAADQREARLLRQRDAPGGEAGARYQDGNAHLHRLDHHLRGQPPGGVEDLVVGRDAVQRSEARRVGKECVSTCRSWWSPCHYKKTKCSIIVRLYTE